MPRDAVIDAQISGGVEAPANILEGKEAPELRPAVQSALLLQVLLTGRQDRETSRLKSIKIDAEFLCTRDTR